MAANPFVVNPFARPIPASAPLEGELLPAKPIVSPDNPFAPGRKPRSALGEIGSQAVGGLVGEVPKQFGQALQYFSEPGQPVYETGKGLAERAEQRLALPQYQPHPEEHGAVVNALASGARMLAPSVAAPLAVGAGLAAIPEAAIGGTAALGLSALAGSVPAALQQGQQTLEDLRAQGVPEEDARAAARRTAAIEGAGETLGTYAGGKLFGIGARALSKAAPAGEAALVGATAPGLVRPFVKQLGETAATEVGTEIGQAAGQAAVEQAYGGKGPSPLEAAQQVVAPTAGLTLLLAPLGLAGFVHGNRAIQKRAAELASEKTDPAARAEAAAAIAQEIHPHDPTAAAQFHANVMADIQAGTPIALGPELLGPRAALARPPLAPPPPLGPVSRALDSAGASQFSTPGSPISPAAVPQGLPLGPLSSSEVLREGTRGTLAPAGRYNVPLEQSDLLLREPQKGGPEVLQGLPRQLYEALAALPPAQRGTAQEKQLRELRERISEKGQDPTAAMRDVWGPNLADAPPGLRQALVSSLALPQVPPTTARGKEKQAPSIGGKREVQTQTKAQPEPSAERPTTTATAGQRRISDVAAARAADEAARQAREVGHAIEERQQPARGERKHPGDDQGRAPTGPSGRGGTGERPTVKGEGQAEAVAAVPARGMDGGPSPIHGPGPPVPQRGTARVAQEAVAKGEPRAAAVEEIKKRGLKFEGEGTALKEPTILPEAARRDLEKAKTPREIKDAKRRIADRLAAATKAAAPERRADVARRKAIAEMSPEEMRRELLTDGLTGLGNRRAWEEADKGPVLASLDMDALKWVNDHMGHASGDKMLAAMGEVLNDVMPGQAFHVSGDEFLAHFEDQKQADRTLGEVADLLNQATVSVRLPDGTTITKTGVGYSYGTGTNLQDAEAGLQRHKAERERTGLRAARGGEPAGVARTAPEGQPDRGRETTKEAVGPRYSRGAEPSKEQPWERSERFKGVEGGIATARAILVSQTLGRGFGQSMEDYLAKNPEVKRRHDAAVAYLRDKGVATKWQLEYLEKEGTPRYSYLGRNAALANHSALGEAIALSRTGTKMEDIRERTGWFKGKDEKWRFEISDKDSKLKPGWVNAKTVGEAFDHQKLFENYPPLADIKFETQDLPTNVNGSYDPKKKTIVLNRALSDKAARSVLLHEIQHVVQNIERFSGGGSPNSKAMQALALKRWEGERKALTERLHELMALQSAWVNASVKSMRKEGAYASFGAAYSAYREKHPGYVSEASKLVKELDALDLNRIAHRTYRRLLGEVEARDVQFRAHLTDKERRLIEPYVSQGIDEKDFITNLKGERKAESRGEPIARAPIAHTAESLKAELREALGAPATARLLRSTLGIVERDEQLPPGLQHRKGGVRGVFDPRTRKTWFVAGNVHKGEAKGLALHEIGTHAGMEEMLGPKVWAHVLGQVEGALGQVEPGVGTVKAPLLSQRYSPEFVAAVKAARARVPNDTRAWLVTEETIANLVEDPANHELPLVRRILAAVRAFLLRMGVPLKNVGPDDLVALARAAVRRVSRGETVQRGLAHGEPAPAYARAAQTATPTFRVWFKGSKVVDEKGEPLVVYHGTNRDFSVFDLSSRGRITRLNPESFKTFAFSDNPDIAAWYGEQAHDLEESRAGRELTKLREIVEDVEHSYLKVMQQLGYIPASGVGLRADLEEDVENAKRLQKVKDRYEQEVKAAQRNRTAVSIMPVYLSIRNPVRVTLGKRGPSLASRIGKAISEGRDGAIVTTQADPSLGLPGGRYFLVFRPEQIKSAIGNVGTFDPANPDIRYSRGTPPPLIARQDPATQEALRKAGVIYHPPTLAARVRAWLPDWQRRVKQGLVDAFDPIKLYDQKAYMKARLTKGADAGLEGLLKYGTLRLDKDGAIEVSYEKGGFLGLMKQLDGEHDLFFGWVAGNRAKRILEEGKAATARVAALKDELKTLRAQRTAASQANDLAAYKRLQGEISAAGKELVTARERANVQERNFNEGDIEKLIALSDGKMADGRSRADVYGQMNRELQRYNRSVMDLAEQAGLIDAETRPFWEKDFYVPFYRVMEEEDTKGPVTGAGLIRQYAFRHMKGGKEVLGDPFENTLKNWSHLISASLKNQAGGSALEAAEAQGAAEVTASTTKGAIWVRKAGKPVYYTVSDPLLLDAVKALNAKMLEGPAMKAMTAMKRALTLGVTIAPAFRVRNLLRDTMQAIGTSDLSYNMLGNVLQGWKGTKEGSADFAQLLAGGGVMRFGTWLEGDRAANVKRLIESGVASRNILTNQARIQAMLVKGWRYWQSTGERAENVNRSAIYQQARARGASHLEASYLARDLMDFSMQGTWGAIRMLTQMVPFMNARMQGLYKLGRAYQEDPVRLMSVTGAVAAASIMLAYAYGDDDDWKAREDWDRDNNWWFKIGDQAYWIPKPFEIGAIASMAERGYQALTDPEFGGRDFADRMGAILWSNLSLNPIPQLFKPLVELYANKDTFTDRPIETEWMQKLSVPLRVAPETSATAQVLGKAGVLSPVQIDHLARGYFGWLGSHVVLAADLFARPALGLADRPAWRTENYPLLGDFAKELPAYQSKYVTKFYDQAEKVQQALGDLKHYRDIGAMEQAKELRAEKSEMLRKGPLVRRTMLDLGKINGQIRRVQQMNLSAEAKRARLDRLYQQRNEKATRASRALEAAP